MFELCNGLGMFFSKDILVINYILTTKSSFVFNFIEVLLLALFVPIYYIQYFM